MILFEAPVSGTSLNPARSFGPAVVTGRWSHFWIYALAPTLGAVLAAELFARSRHRVRCAKLFHTDEYRCPFFDCQYTPPAGRLPAGGGRSPGGRAAPSDPTAADPP